MSYYLELEYKAMNFLGLLVCMEKIVKCDMSGCFIQVLSYAFLYFRARLRGFDISTVPPSLNLSQRNIKTSYRLWWRRFRVKVRSILAHLRALAPEWPV
jgi:hypothetical protein